METSWDTSADVSTGLVRTVFLEKNDVTDEAELIL